MPNYGKFRCAVPLAQQLDFLIEKGMAASAKTADLVDVKKILGKYLEKKDVDEILADLPSSEIPALTARIAHQDGSLWSVTVAQDRGPTAFDSAIVIDASEAQRNALDGAVRDDMVKGLVRPKLSKEERAKRKATRAAKRKSGGGGRKR